MALCGNSVNQSIFMGWDVLRLGGHPFEPESVAPQLLKGRDLDLSSVADAEVYVFPLEAGFIGGDNVAAILATSLDEFDGLALLMDIGTNAEIVCGGRDSKLLVGSTPTGPAFEGGQMKFGMRASRGAIDSVQWVPDKTRTVLTTIGSQTPVGICGSGIIDCLAALWRAGMCDQDGKLLESRFTRTNDEGMREVVLVGPKDRSRQPRRCNFPREPGHRVHAKGRARVAARQGSTCDWRRTDAEKFGREPDKIILAGGFGSYLDVESAIAIGLIPDLPREKMIGNHQQRPRASVRPWWPPHSKPAPTPNHWRVPLCMCPCLMNRSSRTCLANIGLPSI